MKIHRLEEKLIILLASCFVIVQSGQAFLTNYHNDVGGAGVLSRKILNKLSVASIVSTASLDPLSAMLYLQTCEKMRDDITIISRNRFFRQKYRKHFYIKCPILKTWDNIKKKTLNNKITLSFDSSLINLFLVNNQPLFWEGLDAKAFSMMQPTPDGFLFKVHRLNWQNTENKNSCSNNLSHYESFLDSFTKNCNYLGKRILANNWFNYSLYYLHNKDMINALRCIKKTVLNDPFNEAAINNLVSILAINGNYQKALTLVNKALQTFPANSNLYFNQALLYQTTNQSKLALLSFNNAVYLAPERGERWLAYGKALLNSNKLIQAKKALKRSLQCKKHSPEAWLILSRIYRLMNNQKAALEASDNYKREMQ